MTGRPCKHGHTVPRWTRTQMCMGCIRRNAWLNEYRAITPAWADLAAIDAIYQAAARRSDETGTPHEVDHVIPRNHPLVCGLHVEGNLQILTTGENRLKGNMWDGYRRNGYRQKMHANILTMKDSLKEFEVMLAKAGLKKTALAAVLGIKVGTIYRWTDETVPQYVWAYLGVVTK